MQKLKPYVNFLFEVGVLNRTPRSGFRHLGGWKQSVSDHLLRTAYVGFVIAHLEKNRGVKVDIARVTQICLFHDLGEARAIDLDYISQKYSKADELGAISDAVKHLSFGPEIIKVFKEAEERTTIEGVIARDADQIELLCSLKEVMDNGNTQAKSWIPALMKRLKTPTAKALSKLIVKTSTNDWWFENKKDEYWVKGGKNKK
jgi:putative hydrolases of HD superfamily